MAILARIEAEEAEHERDIADSGDGIVHEYGRPGLEASKEPASDDGQTE